MNKESLNIYLDKLDTLEEVKVILSEHIKTAKDRHIDREHEINGTTLTEKELWDEIYIMGALNDHRASKKLRELYPEIFEYAEKEAKLIKDAEQYALVEFGFDPTRMTPRYLVRLIEGIIDIKLAEK